MLFSCSRSTITLFISTQLLTVLTNSVIVLLEQEKSTAFPAVSYTHLIYDKDGNGYIIQGDSAGYLHLIDGKEGNIKSSVLLNGNIESSPAVFNNVLVVATRNGTIYGVKVK